MMKFSKIALAAALMLAASAAMAKDNGNDCNGNGSCSGGTPSTATSTSGAAAGAIAVGVGMGGSATGGSSSVGNVAGGSVGNVSGGSSTAGSVGNVGALSTVKNLSPEANSTSSVLGSGNSSSTSGVVGSGNSAAVAGVKDSGNGTATVTINESSGLHYSGEYKVKNVDGIALGGPASGPCNGFSGGFSLAVPGASAAANTSTVNKGCEQREAVRVAAMIGQMDIAVLVLKNIDVVKEAIAEEDARKKRVAAATQSQATASNQQWMDSTNKVVYTGTDETIIKRLGLVPASSAAVASK